MEPEDTLVSLATDRSGRLTRVEGLAASVRLPRGMVHSTQLIKTPRTLHSQNVTPHHITVHYKVMLDNSQPHTHIVTNI